MRQNKINKNFNVIIAGTGGQGLITAGRILAKAIFLEKKEIKMSELHGLSQRGGSVVIHLRMGKNIYSPLINRGEADLILVLEKREIFSSLYFASKSKGTIFLINDCLVPSPSLPNFNPSNDKIKKIINGFSKKIIFIPASKIMKEKLGKEIVSSIFLISFASFKNLIPVKPKSILKAIKESIPKKYLDINVKAFNLAEKVSF